MEPCSAISLAAAIVQFIQFGCSIMSKACEIYKSPSGSSSDHVELEIVANDTKELCGRLCTPPIEISNVEIEHEPLVKMAKQCREAADEILNAVARAQAKGEKCRKWRSFRQALMGALRKDEVDCLQKKMRTLQSRIKLQMAQVIM